MYEYIFIGYVLFRLVTSLLQMSEGEADGTAYTYVVYYYIQSDS